MLKGYVKWFDESKGFGFILADGKDYFIHFREIKSAGFKTLKEGERVMFMPSQSQKGLVAKNVSRACDDEPLNGT